MSALRESFLAVERRGKCRDRFFNRPVEDCLVRVQREFGAIGEDLTRGAKADAPLGQAFSHRHRPGAADPQQRYIGRQSLAVD